MLVDDNMVVDGGVVVDCGNVWHYCGRRVRIGWWWKGVGMKCGDKNVI